MKQVDMNLVEAVGTLLAQSAATHVEFFEHVDEYLRKRGYQLQAVQRGIAGTHVSVVKTEHS